MLLAGVGELAPAAPVDVCEAPVEVARLPALVEVPALELLPDELDPEPVGPALKTKHTAR